MKVSFRGNDDETGVTKYNACGCDANGDLSNPGTNDCSSDVSPNGQVRIFKFTRA